MKVTWSITAALACLCSGQVCSAATIHVDGNLGTDSAGAHWGSTWQFPYATLEYALSRASPGDTILLARATYMAPAAGFELVDGVTIQGGWVRALAFPGGDWTYIFEPPMQPSRAVLTGEFTSPAPESVLVAIDLGTEEANRVRLENLIIAEGGGDSMTTGSKGGGLRIEGSKVSAFDCRFVSNIAESGGAVFVGNVGSFAATDCEFLDNDASGGGAIWFGDGQVGGGMLLSRSSFIQNSAYSGGAIYVDQLYEQDSDIVAVNCIFSQNVAFENGGAISLTFGDGLFNMINCSMSQNQAGDDGSAIWQHPFGPPYMGLRLRNTIVWADASATSPPLDIAPTASVRHSIIQHLADTGLSGLGNSDSNPFFLDPDSHNLDLSQWSCAINSGDTAAYPGWLPPLDFDGDARVQFHYGPPGCGATGNVIDIGAHEVSYGNWCAADYAEPWGVLDLADVLDFVSAFTTQDPRADLAPPFQVLDISDLIAFIEAFTTGCP